MGFYIHGSKGSVDAGVPKNYPIADSKSINDRLNNIEKSNNELIKTILRVEEKATVMCNELSIVKENTEPADNVVR